MFAPVLSGGGDLPWVDPSVEGKFRSLIDRARWRVSNCIEAILGTHSVWFGMSAPGAKIGILGCEAMTPGDSGACCA